MELKTERPPRDEQIRVEREHRERDLGPEFCTLSCHPTWAAMGYGPARHPTSLGEVLRASPESSYKLNQQSHMKNISYPHLSEAQRD